MKVRATEVRAGACEVQLDTLEITATLQCPLLTGVVHQHLPHHLRGYGEEMSPIYALYSVAENTHVGFVNQRGGLERVIAALPAHERLGKSAKLRVQQRCKPPSRFGVAVSNGA